MFKTLESYRTPPGYGFPRCYFRELFNIPLVSVSWQVNHTMSCCHSCVPFHYPQKETQSLYLHYKAWLSQSAHILPNPRHIPFTEARLCSLQTVSSSGPLHMMMVSVPGTLSSSHTAVSVRTLIKH